jgi:hypothetical protein
MTGARKAASFPNAAFASARCASKHETPCSLTAPLWLSFLAGAIVTGIGQARHVEFDRVAAFVASGHKATKDETGQGQNDVAHLSSPGSAHAERLLGRECRAGQNELDHDCFSSIAYDLYHFGSSRDLIPELCNFFKIML